MPFTNYAVDAFISPHITALTECRATDIASEFPNSSSWVSSFGLTVIFNNQPPAPHRPFVLQFIRRAEMAIVEYALMRTAILDLQAGTGRWSPYYRALHHAESAASMLYQAHDFARKKLAQKLFHPNDNSPLQRLNEVYGKLKHELALASETVWLSNDGICTAGAVLTFGEFEDLIRDCANIVEALLAHRPASDPTASSS